MIMCVVTLTTVASTSPLVIVLATATPIMAPMRFVNVASTMACRGESTLVETTVAMELAVSWKPLMYSKINATSTTVRISSIAPQEFFSTMWVTTLPASRQRSMTRSRSS